MHYQYLVDQPLNFPDPMAITLLLNGHGEDGWRYVGVIPQRHGTPFFVFERLTVTVEDLEREQEGYSILREPVAQEDMHGTTPA